MRESSRRGRAAGAAAAAALRGLDVREVAALEAALARSLGEAAGAHEDHQAMMRSPTIQNEKNKCNI